MAKNEAVFYQLIVLMRTGHFMPDMILHMMGLGY